MWGPIALVGGDEFLPAMAEFDRGLLEATGRPRPRVVVLPTAAWPDGEAAFQRCAVIASDHFRSLGAEVEPVFVGDHASAADAAHCQAIGEADVVYVAGGHAAHLQAVVTETALGDALLSAHERGAVVAGCAAGAMVLADRQPQLRRRLVPWPVMWRRGLGIVPGTVVLPRYDRWPEALLALVAMPAARRGTVVGIDAATAVVGRNGAWQVYGGGRVTVWRGRSRERFRRGEAFRL